MHRLPIEELERRVQAYDPDSATRAEWEAHVEFVRELFRCRVRMHRLIDEAPHTEN